MVARKTYILKLYVAGNTPNSMRALNTLKEILENEFKNQGLNFIGWREVPVNKSVLGKISAKTEPYISQIFVEKGNISEHEFNVKLFIARKISENKI